MIMVDWWKWSWTVKEAKCYTCSITHGGWSALQKWFFFSPPWKISAVTAVFLFADLFWAFLSFISEQIDTIVVSHCWAAAKQVGLHQRRDVCVWLLLPTPWSPLFFVFSPLDCHVEFYMTLFLVWTYQMFVLTWPRSALSIKRWTFIHFAAFLAGDSDLRCRSSMCMYVWRQFLKIMAKINLYNTKHKWIALLCVCLTPHRPLNHRQLVTICVTPT